MTTGSRVPVGDPELALTVGPVRKTTPKNGPHSSEIFANVPPSAILLTGRLGDGSYMTHHQESGISDKIPALDAKTAV